MKRTSLVLNFAFFFGIPHIYGPDSRRDIKDVQDVSIRNLAKSVAALIPSKSLHSSDSKDFFIAAPNFITQYGLIKGPLEMTFGEQPAAAQCSGTLISEKVILTAGHCVENKSELENLTWVFDYQMPVSNSVNPVIEIPSENVFKISRVLEDYFHPFDVDGYLKDYAIVELDRPVQNRPFAKFHFQDRTTVLQKNIGMLGFPSGLPLKYTNDAKVLSLSGEVVLHSNLDAFAGNSGSPVFLEETGEIIGILVRGPISFEPHQGSLLYRIKQVLELKSDTPLTDIYDVRDIPYLTDKKPFSFEVKEVPCVIHQNSKICVKSAVERTNRKTLEELEVYGIIEKLWNTGKAEIIWHSPWGAPQTTIMQIDRVIPSLFRH